MGKCYSVKRKQQRLCYDNTPAFFNYVTDRHQLTQHEKWDFLMSIKNDPEGEVVRKIKADPSLLSCVFWFEYYETEHNYEKEYCTCSQALELCYKKEIPSDEMVKRMELSLRTNRCPHVALAKAGTPVSCKQDISSWEVSRSCDTPVPLGVLRHKRRLTAGVYWVHLAAIYDKKEIINHILPFAVECDICDDYFKTLRHRFTPIDVALANRKFEIAVSIATIDPRILVNDFFGPVNHDEEFFSIQLNRCLEFKHLESFKKLFSIFRLHEEPYRVWMPQEFFNKWPYWVAKFSQDGCTETVKCLLSIENVSLEYYATLLKLVHEKGLYWLCDMIVAESDIRLQMSRASREHIRQFDTVMIKAVFSNEPHVVKLFIDIGLNKDAEIEETSVLAWAEYFEFNSVAQCLRTSKAKINIRRDSPSMLYILIDAHKDYFFGLDLLPLVHRLYQMKNEEVLNETIVADALQLAWHTFKYDIFHYLLLQGANPKNVINSPYPCALWYHLLCANTFVDGDKLLNAFWENTATSYRIYSAIALSSIDELSSLPLTTPTFDLNQVGDELTFCFYFEKLWREWYEPVRPLSTLCRRALRKHFKRHLYYWFLETLIDVLPKATMQYLTMSELLCPISEGTNCHNSHIKRASEFFKLDSRLFENLNSDSRVFKNLNSDSRLFQN